MLFLHMALQLRFPAESLVASIDLAFYFAFTAAGVGGSVRMT
jgi:hypothetical protein